LRQQRVRAGDRDNGIHLIGIQNGPLERLHAAQRSARDRGKPRDTELVEKGPLGPHHVGHSNHRKLEPERLSGRRIRRCGPRGPSAPPEQVR
jgi:hypothetical protein